MIHNLDIKEIIISFIIDVCSQEDEGKNQRSQASYILVS